MGLYHPPPFVPSPGLPRIPVSFVFAGTYEGDSLQYQLQAGPVQRHLVTAIGAVMEPALLQPLRPDAVSAPVKVQHLDVGPLPVDEHEQMSTEGILPESVLHQRRQAVERLPHIGGPGV